MTSYYISTTGNDSNPGTLTQPWLTISRAMNSGQSPQVQAGDIVYVRSGIYDEKVNINISGTTGNYIILKNYTGEMPIIDGQANTDGSTTGGIVAKWSGLVQISNRSYIKISGFTIKNSTWSGIQTDGSSNIIIENNDITNTYSSGIQCRYGNNITADNNEISYAANGKTWFKCSTTGITYSTYSGCTSSCSGGSCSVEGPGKDAQECLSFVTINGFEIKNNYVHHKGRAGSGGEGIDAKNSSKNGTIHHNHVELISMAWPYNGLGIYVDVWDTGGLSNNIEIYNNKIHNCNYGIALNGEHGGTVDGVNIYNNLIYDNNSHAIVTGGNYTNESSPIPVIKNIKIFNNTIYKNNRGHGYGALVIGNPVTDGKHRATIQNITVKNNIFSENDYNQIYVCSSGCATTQTNIVVDKNLIYGTSSYTGINYISLDPKFVDKTNFDLHLQSSSPAINAGVSTDAPTFDYDNNDRPVGSGYDIGAFEYDSSVVTPTITVTSPNGGEAWSRDMSKYITWTLYNNTDPYVKIELLNGDIVDIIITENAPNSGSYLWVIPTDLSLDNDYKIRITSYT